MENLIKILMKETKQKSELEEKIKRLEKIIKGLQQENLNLIAKNEDLKEEVELWKSIAKLNNDEKDYFWNG